MFLEFRKNKKALIESFKNKDEKTRQSLFITQLSCIVSVKRVLKAVCRQTTAPAASSCKQLKCLSNSSSL